MPLNLPGVIAAAIKPSASHSLRSWRRAILASLTGAQGRGRRGVGGVSQRSAKAWATCHT